MRIGLVIADFETKLSSTFKHAARVKYDVDFATSNVGDVKANLQRLKSNMESGSYNHISIRGYDPTIEEVADRIDLLERILKKYREVFDVAVIPSTTKLYRLMEQLQQAATPTTEQIVDTAVKRITTAPEPKKLTSKAKLQAEADRLSQERALKVIQDNSAKNKQKPL